MKKCIYLLVLLLLQVYSFTVKAQSSYMGLIAYSYSETTNSNEDIKKINKPLFIIYNRNYCELSIGGIVSYFKVDAYSKELNKGDLKEDFLNDETDTKPRGWFSIEIIHNAPGKSQITINMPLISGGKAYFVTNAQVYSENGKVTGKLHVNNWKEIEGLSVDNVTNVNYEKNPQLKNLAFKTNLDINKYVSLNTNWESQEKQEGYLGEIRFRGTINKNGKITTLNQISEMLISSAGKDVITRVQNVVLSMPNWTLRNGIKRPLQPQTFDLTIILNPKLIPIINTK